MPPTTSELIIDAIGILVTGSSVLILFDLKNKLRGRIGSALNFIMIGVLFNAAALMWDFVFSRLVQPPEGLPDIHHFLMIIGTIFFVIAAHNFSKVAQPE